MINAIIKKCSWCNTDSGLLVLRIGVGAIFIFSGWMKISTFEMTLTNFAFIGFSAFWVYLVTAAELLGGIAVLLGICTRTAAFILSIVMIVAIIVVYKDMSVVMTPISLLFSSIALVLSDGGKYSIYRKSV